jgi:manganese oxidase
MLHHHNPSPPRRGGTQADPAATVPPPHTSLLLTTALLLAAPLALPAQECERTIEAEVVALDQPIFYNRFGSFAPQGMIFALRRDVVAEDGGETLRAGQVRLREGKRPRPLVLRANEGDCLVIHFQNLLAPEKADEQQPATRTAGIHVIGMQLVRDTYDDGSFVGENPSSLVHPGDSRTYELYAETLGTYLLYSSAATVGGEGAGGSLSAGLFGAVNVEPRGAEWYRSQVTEAELRWATTGWTDTGHPIIDYHATYPEGHAFEGLPILAMLQGNEIVHSDLNAIITGPGRGSWAPDKFPKVRVAGDRTRPYREFTIIFHDEAGLVPAFPEFDDHRFEYTLEAGRDGFSINYGSDGVGAPVLANRFGVGPSWDCAECKYEEFFLSSWTRGDPGLLVDQPANTRDASGELIRGPKATKVLYPDDPSNVYHAYLGDRVIFHNLHAGPKEHHVFHLHAHQWLRTPSADRSDYLDSQTIGPGGGYRYELVYHGAGNRNLTPGDAIFHCHFYPHFAQGMWGLMRVLDVLETGTVLDADGVPVTGARTLPDGELEAGVPIPAVVPIPGQPLPPLPHTMGNPGYPHFIPGIAGRRAPQPPLDMVFDGGLPRHVVRSGEADFPELNTLSFRKENVRLDAVELPQEGTELERAAMAFHETPEHPTVVIDAYGSVLPAAFRTNGAGRSQGGAFADPCYPMGETPAGRHLTYKGASIQIDARYTKTGWHFAQHRMFALWDDVDDYLSGRRAPEPLFMRTNTGDCIEYHLVNLAPKEYQMDDFQVLTPTDVMGQHIHLVKFDVLTADGAANGFNYEDGSMAPDEVLERIKAINLEGGLLQQDGGRRVLAALPHPYFGPGPDDAWLGAQQTVQRWHADDVLNASDQDRTLGTIFTHDHFAPSTIQQTGLYAVLAAEPAGSTWWHNERDAQLGTRHDGGPTSWAARIVTPDTANSFREFMLMTADFVPAYDAAHQGLGPAPELAINPPGRALVGPPFLTEPPFRRGCPNGEPAPCPELASADHPGTMLVNYRAEPLALRSRDPATNLQAEGLEGDLSRIFQTRTSWADRDLRRQPDFYPPLTGGVERGDPFTPLLRAYQGDRVLVRAVTGAHEHGHNFTIHGMKWLEQPSWPESGWRASQMVSISEHFEMSVPTIPDQIAGDQVDRLYTFGASADDLWSGTWGIFRGYRRIQNDLATLPNNRPTGQGNNRVFGFIANLSDFNGVCPKDAPVRRYELVAALARDVLQEGTLVYHDRAFSAPGGFAGPLHDPTAILYLRAEDLDPETGVLRPGAPVEPLVLRANAGDCITVELENRLPADPEDMPDFDGYSGLPSIIDRYNANQVRPSNWVGLHAQLVALDQTRHDGSVVGTNPVSLAAPGDTTSYRWYAGHLSYDPATRMLTPEPAEFGAVNLLPSDRIKHGMKGAVGGLIVQPPGSTWVEDAEMPGCGEPGNPACSRAVARVTGPGGTFREFVVFFQNDLNFLDGHGNVIPNFGTVGEDSEETGWVAFNYRTEPMWVRMAYHPEDDGDDTRDVDFTESLSNPLVGGDPVTPVFLARTGDAVRFRILHPAGGRQREHTFQLHGHLWQRSPYTARSGKKGYNALSPSAGIIDGIGPSGSFDILVAHGAGGAFEVPGDYLYRDQVSTHMERGLWGILRVGDFEFPEPEEPEPAPVAEVKVSPNNANIPPGGTVQLDVTLRDVNGTLVTGRAVTWASSDERVATVSATALVTAHALGTATITATSEGVSGSVNVTVCELNPGGRCRRF